MMKKLTAYITVVALALLPLLVPAPAHAAGLFGGNNSTSKSKCGNTQTEFIACDSKTGLGTINDLIKIAVIVLSVLVGAVAVGAIAYASIVYASARDEQTKVNEAKTLVRNVVIGLLLYGFTIAIINWLLPGAVIDAPEPSPTGTVSPSPTQTP